MNLISPKETVIISSCLVGINTRFDGKNKYNPDIFHFLSRKYYLLPYCPETIGGLPVPRPRAWLQNGTGKDVLNNNSKVINANNQDVTHFFIKGALKVKVLISKYNIKTAYLKSKSPSCGINLTYSSNNTLIKGNGVFAEFLSQLGLKIFSVD